MKQKRIYALLIDLLIIAIPFVLALLIGVFVLNKDFLSVFYPAMALGLLLLLLKDLAGGRSLGKYFIGLHIENVTNKSVLVLRNIPLIVFPLEGIVFLFQDSRIGDTLFKTQVVADEQPTFKRNTELLAGVFIVAAFVYLSVKSLAGHYVRQRQEYILTEAFVYGSKAIQEKTGKIIKMSKVPRYSIKRKEGQTEVRIETTVYGSKDNAKMDIFLKKNEAGEWEVSHYDYKE